MDRTFVGFGFGAIQAGLFGYEAWRSGNFSRLVVAEVVPDVVAAVRAAGGLYGLNIAAPAGIERCLVGPISILNPRDAADRQSLVDAVAQASEIATALPSVQFYGHGERGDMVDILAAGLAAKARDRALSSAVIYTAENRNDAAEILEHALAARLGSSLSEARVQILNTVIGKMSGVVTDARQIAEQALAPLAPNAGRAFLVESFNHILISRILIPGFRRGIDVFEEKPDLLPFEEAKLYGHNATHALLGFLLQRKGAAYMSEIVHQPALHAFARDAFLEESGAALCRKHGGLDPLFTERGYQAYADDLLQRMANPHLRDAVDRVTRDPRRKLGWDDRLVGTMRVALAQGIRPWRYAMGAAAALRLVAAEERISVSAVLESLWPEARASSAEAEQVRSLVLESDARLDNAK